MHRIAQGTVTTIHHNHQDTWCPVPSPLPYHIRWFKHTKHSKIRGWMEWWDPQGGIIWCNSTQEVPAMELFLLAEKTARLRGAGGWRGLRITFANRDQNVRSRGRKIGRGEGETIGMVWFSSAVRRHVQLVEWEWQWLWLVKVWLWREREGGWASEGGGRTEDDDVNHPTELFIHKFPWRCSFASVAIGCPPPPLRVRFVAY